jgi:hypothetical protein
LYLPEKKKRKYRYNITTTTKKNEIYDLLIHTGAMLMIILDVCA